MGFPIKSKKSAGVPVTATVHRLIAHGNRLRGSDWMASTAAYRAALDADPSLYHIWIQLGHTQAETGAYEEAIATYQTASRLRRDAGEPWLHMGHAAKRAGDPPRAVRFYMAAAARSGIEDEATVEAERLIHGIIKPPRSLMRRLGARISDDGSLPSDSRPTDSARETLGALAIALGKRGDHGNDASVLADAGRVLGELEHKADASAMGTRRPIVFDVTDLIAHFRHHRLPTGIQRVQIEVIATALKTYGEEFVSVCCFIDGRNYWVGISGNRFLELAHLASSESDNGDPQWLAATGELFIRLATDDDFVIPDRATLVNLGTSWWIYDYYRLIRNAKAEKDILYIPFVHDFIPVMAPEHCVRGVTGDYVSWLVGVFQHADFFLVNSESTRRDLYTVAERLGHILPSDRTEVVTLDADFRSGAEPLPESELERWGLEGKRYALLVSTIESRKNHVLAFDTWAHLIREHGVEAVPQLVCVGRNGWLNDRAFERLVIHRELREKVTIIHQVSDEELALLYRSSQFTVYPSHYEGWGLPVTESLCYGRVPVIADNSSLPEAGAGFAEIFASDSIPDFARAITAVAFDDERRRQMEADIGARFKPRSWRAVADQIGTAIVTRDADETRAQASLPEVVPGRYYPMHLYREPAIWRGLASGEIFRIGDGWLWPETTGCRTRTGGGEFAFRLAEPITHVRTYLHISGLASAPAQFTVSAGDAIIVSGRLAAGETRWVTADLPPAIGAEISMRLTGSATEPVTMNTGGSLKTISGSISLLGFGICDRDDEAQRARFVEAIAYEGVDSVNAYRRSD